MVPAPQVGDIWRWSHSAGIYSYVLLIEKDTDADYIKFWGMELEDGYIQPWSFRPHLMPSWEHLA
jgi:hypothetical protein